MGPTLKTWHQPYWHRHLAGGMGNPVVVRPSSGVSSRGSAARRIKGEPGKLEGQQS
jgi:hypothetical protein